MEINKEAQLKRLHITKAHDFQIVGKAISDWCGKPAYFLFSQYEYGKVLQAFDIAQKKGKRSVRYIIGIIRKL